MASTSAAFGEQVPAKPERVTLAKDIGSSRGVRSYGPARDSLSDFAEQFECLVNEKRDLTFRLTKALAENATLSQLHKQACADLDSERNRQNNQNGEPASLQSLLAAKEKLMREEFE